MKCPEPFLVTAAECHSPRLLPLPAATRWLFSLIRSDEKYWEGEECRRGATGGAGGSGARMRRGQSWPIISVRGYLADDCSGPSVPVARGVVVGLLGTVFFIKQRGFQAEEVSGVPAVTEDGLRPATQRCGQEGPGHAAPGHSGVRRRGGHAISPNLDLCLRGRARERKPVLIPHYLCDL